MTKLSPLMSVRQMIDFASREGVPMRKIHDRDGNPISPKQALFDMIDFIVNDPHRPYYTLETRDRDETEWYPQFGSWDRHDVVAESAEYRKCAKRIVISTPNL